jgi:2-methylisocitrate lyase-like PEP mutase family enzyme
MRDLVARRAAFAARIRARRFTLAPGIFDFISLRVAERVGFEALYLSGYASIASNLGLPDAGLASYAEMVAMAGKFAQGTDIPVIADADTGFGGRLNIHHTVQGYERAGVCALQLEDQEFPKKCGHTTGRRVIDATEMVARIRIAVAARSDPNLLIVARTDARTSLGLDEALVRARAYRAAGADVIFVEAPESGAEFARIGATVDAPLLANMVESGRSPILPAAELEALGFTIAIYPGTGMFAVAAALAAAFTELKARGCSDGRNVALASLATMHDLTGFPAVWDLEAKWQEEFDR